MYIFGTLILMISTTVLTAGDACDNKTFTEEELFEKFILPPSKTSRPVLNSNDVLDMNFTFFMTAFNDILERERILRITGFFKLEWVDELRKWDHASPHNCCQFITIVSERVWIPDVAQTNSKDHYSLVKLPGELLRIYGNGNIVYAPGGTLEVFCSFDITWFPFDYQQCEIILESWMYSTKYLQYHIPYPTYIFTEGNEQWSILSVTQTVANASNSFRKDLFSRLVFTITVKRKVMYYLMNVIIPSIIIAAAHLTTFMLPAGHIKKINISFTCLLAYAVFQVMVVGDLPRSSDNISLLSIYINLQMAYIALSMSCEGLAFYAIDRAKSTKLMPPSVLILYASKMLGRILCVAGSDFNTTLISELSLIGVRKTSPAIRWLYVSKVIERTTAVGYFLAVAISTLIMFGLYPLVIVKQPE